MLRRANVTALLILGSVWAATLVVVGALLALGGLPAWVALGPLGWLAGPTFIAAGQFVFMVVVADRLFPEAARGFTGVVETGVGLIMVAGVALFVVVLLAGV